MNAQTKAAAWMLGAVASFTSMAVAGRLLSTSHDTFEIMLFRSAIGLALVCGWARASGQWPVKARAPLWHHFLRNLAHFTGQNLWFFALTLIPLAQLFALEFTTPLWVALLAPLIVQERLIPAQLLIILLGVAGVLVITLGGGPEGIAQLNIGTFAAAAAAIGFALSALTTRRLTRVDSTLTILFFLTLMQLGMGLICAGWDGDIAWPTLSTAPGLILIGLAGLMAHLCMTQALSLAQAAFVMPVDFLRLPLIAVIGWMMFDEPVSRVFVLGAALILSANALNLWLQRPR